MSLLGLNLARRCQGSTDIPLVSYLYTTAQQELHSTSAMV